MDEAIKNICQALKEEAEAIIRDTDSISAVSKTEGADASQADSRAAAVQTLALIRLDEVEHIQRLCIELTMLVSGSGKGGAGCGESEAFHGNKA